MAATTTLEWPHGTLNGYNNHGCRCEHCRTAMTQDKTQRRRRHAEQTLAADDPRHGTANGYRNLYCRCERCCEANTAHFRAYRERRAEALEAAADAAERA